ncbi:hypothetical protein [Vulgatibacter sp.]|uniref:hypothetical protein n=1 Tax=Vulgatibacter sp. TaxID=1971226 RepID=UPI0035693487
MGIAFGALWLVALLAQGCAHGQVPQRGHLVVRTEEGGTIRLGDREASLDQVRADCRGPFTIVEEREVVVGFYREEKSETTGFGLFTASHEETSVQHPLTAWELSYRCDEPRPLRPALANAGR